MFYFEYPLIDTTLYEASPSSSTNTGIDEILEVRKDMNDSGTQIDVSRILMKFVNSPSTRDSHNICRQNMPHNDFINEGLLWILA